MSIVMAPNFIRGDDLALDLSFSQEVVQPLVKELVREYDVCFEE
jgi:hypothetical protein